MKIITNIRYHLRRYIPIVVMSLLWISCEDDRAITYSESATQEMPDPYLQVVTGFVPFEVGTPEYELEFNVINGTNAITALKLFGTFFDAGSGKSSNEMLFGEYPVTSPLRTVITDKFTYNELKTGLTVDGTPLPAADADVFPGSGWSFRFEGVRAGQSFSMIGSINMVLSKYAGIYKVTGSTYMRIQLDPVVLPPDGVAEWDGEEVFIGFVDQNTLSYNDRWGVFAWPGGSFNFSYDEDGRISGPVLTASGLFSGTELATCGDNKNAFNNLSTYLGYSVCDQSNVIIDNDATGEHVIKLTYGYLGGGGYRQFTETLTKIVN